MADLDDEALAELLQSLRNRARGRAEPPHMEDPLFWDLAAGIESLALEVQSLRERLQGEEE